MSTVAATVLLIGLIAWRLRPQATPRRLRTSTAHSKRRRTLGVGIISASLALVISPLLAAIVVLVALMVARLSAVQQRSRSRRRIAADFPDALDLLVLSIRAGYLPSQAAVEIAPFLTGGVRHAFDAVGCAMQQGLRFADALSGLSAELGPVAEPLVDSLSAADRYGLPLAPVLERLSLEARQQRRRDSDAAARELPVRLAIPLVLCTLPSFVLLAIVPLLLGALSSLHT